MRVAVRKLVRIGLAWAILSVASVVVAADPAPSATPTTATSSASTTTTGAVAPAPAVAPTTAAPSQAAEASSGQAQEAGSAAESAAPAGSSAAAGSSEEAESGEAAMDGETYQVRLRDLEQRVDELKEQIRRSHTRLSLLSDTILAGASGGGRAEIQFNNELSGAWHVVEAVFVLDGAVQYKKTDDTGVLAKQTTIPIFSGSVPTGDHTLQVMLKLRGHGFGVFSYLRGIEATVRASHSFTLSDGKVLELKVIGWEKGGPTTPVEQQPDIRFNSVVRSLTDMPEAAPSKATEQDKGSSKLQSSGSGNAGVGNTTGEGSGGTKAGGRVGTP